MAYDRETQVETEVGRCMMRHTLRNDMRSSPVFRYQRKRRSGDNDDDADASQAEEQHNSSRLLQRICSVCNKHRTTYYCEECTTANAEIVPVCNCTRHEDIPCFVLHVDQMSK